MKDFIKRYVELSKHNGEPGEAYKYLAIDTFQQNWNLEADNFYIMFRNSFSKVSNLLYQNSWGFIEIATRLFPEDTRKMFRDLYDESVDISQRIKRFQSQSEQLLPKVKQKSGKNNFNTQQDERTISVYLAFRFPEKYILYKFDYYDYFCKSLEIQPYKTGKRFLHLQELANEIIEHGLLNDNNFINTYREFYPKPNWNDNYLMIQNVLFVVLYYSKKESAPLENNSTPKNQIEMKDTYTNLLESNKNIILTGAPGTGKTYLAKQIAKQMIGIKTDKELEESGQLSFVQFHPSYDYTDFVEGLRPTPPDENGNIGFERRDGSFKAFCRKALKATIADEVDNFDEAWENLIALIKDNLAEGKLTKIGSWDYGLSKKNTLKYSSVNTPSQYTFTITKQNVYDAYQNKKARPSGAFQKDMEDIVHFMKEYVQLKDYKHGTIVDRRENLKYIFVIDEINRGEISKIFGELFFSIDPGYRGVKGKVQTQYTNLIDDSDVFKDGFYVPENVYIIGTMNDIDRSVESMDFAMRRRFAWKEIKAVDRISMWNGNIDEWKEETKERMLSLNQAIENINGLSSAYHIGPAYFLKLAIYDGNFEELWNIHLQGVLSEYLRGFPNAEEELSKLKNAYNLS